MLLQGVQYHILATAALVVMGMILASFITNKVRIQLMVVVSLFLSSFLLVSNISASLVEEEVVDDIEKIECVVVRKDIREVLDDVKEDFIFSFFEFVESNETRYQEPFFLQNYQPLYILYCRLLIDFV